MKHGEFTECAIGEGNCWQYYLLLKLCLKKMSGKNMKFLVKMDGLE